MAFEIMSLKRSLLPFSGNTIHSRYIPFLIFSSSDLVAQDFIPQISHIIGIRLCLCVQRIDDIVTVPGFRYAAERSGDIDWVVNNTIIGKKRMFWIDYAFNGSFVVFNCFMMIRLRRFLFDSFRIYLAK